MENEVDVIKPKSKRVKRPSENTIYKAILALVLLIVVAGLSFWGGISYQKHHNSASVATTNSNSQGDGGFGGRFANSGRTFGKVTVVSSTSITVQSDFGNTQSKTFTITSSTTVTNQGQTSSVSAIAVGDTVVITAASSNSSDAGTIAVNPSFGGFGNSSSAPGSSINGLGGSSTNGSSTGSTTNGSNTTGSATLN